MNKKTIILVITLICFLVICVTIVKIAEKKHNNIDQETAYKNAANKLFPGIKFGDVIKKVNDPDGNVIKIIKDEDYGAIVDLNYFRDKARDMSINSKHLSDEEIENLDVTSDQKKAIESVVSYIVNGGLSYQIAADELFIREALAYKGYDSETIEFALTHAGIDWSEQAHIQALVLLSENTSKDELIETMKDMGFSEEIAIREANRDEINYYEQAVALACRTRFYQEINYIVKPEDGVKPEKGAVRELLQLHEYNTKETEYALEVVFDKIKVK